MRTSRTRKSAASPSSISARHPGTPKWCRGRSATNHPLKGVSPSGRRFAGDFQICSVRLQPDRGECRRGTLSSMLKKLFIAAAALVALLVVIAIGAAMLIDVNQFRPTIESSLQSAVGRKVSLGKLGLSLLAGSISVENVSIADDPKFGAEPFVTTKAVKVAVDVWPLIVSRTLHVRSLTLEEPHILLRRSAAGTWNFASIGGQAAASASAPAGS